jgi:hypothetical protein
MWRCEHHFHIEVFNRNQLVLPSVVIREFVEEITPLALDIEMAPNNTPTLFLPVVRLVLFPEEFPLLSFEPVAFLREVELFNRYAVCIVGILQNAHINPDHLFGVNILQRSRRWRFCVHFDAENRCVCGSTRVGETTRPSASYC